MKRNLLLLIAIVCLAGIAIVQNVSGQRSIKTQVLPTQAAPKVDFLAPSFELQDLNGQTYKVGGKRDKILMINFWASWCEPCQLEAPDLKRIYEENRDHLDMYSVNVTSYDKLDKAKKFVDDYKLTNPILLDTKGDKYKLYNGIAFPTNVLIDRNGVIRDITLGIVPAKQLESKIEKLIKE